MLLIEKEEDVCMHGHDIVLPASEDLTTAAVECPLGLGMPARFYTCTVHDGRCDRLFRLVSTI
jgi:hypothetical protein